MTLIRPLDADDLDDAIALWDRATTKGAPPVFGVADAVRVVTDGSPAFAAVRDDELVGTVVVKLERDRAWLLRWVVDPDHRGRGVGSALLDEALRAVRDSDAERISAVLPVDEEGQDAFAARGFSIRSGLQWFELPLRQRPIGPEAELGARHIDADAWEQLAGMTAVKDLIERRVVLPLADPVAAAEYGVRPPQAIILFGPPGTGKTTFARAIAGRLQWPFVELRPSALTDRGREGQAGRLREFFTAVDALERVVVFIDEVEEIAAARGGNVDRHAVTNELLKVIPAFREGRERLLVCATNAIGDLDQALRRPGRFDYLLPVGPPDLEARTAIWSAYLAPARGSESVDMAELAAASNGATPADIEFAARTGAQRAFERAVQGIDEGGIRTNDLLAVWAEVGPSLTRDDLRGFEDDIDTYSRH